jgi:hypothetical protein
MMMMMMLRLTWCGIQNHALQTMGFHHPFIDKWLVAAHSTDGGSVQHTHLGLDESLEDAVALLPAVVQKVVQPLPAQTQTPPHVRIGHKVSCHIEKGGEDHEDHYVNDEADPSPLE